MRATHAETHLPPAPAVTPAVSAAGNCGAPVLLACGNPLRQDDGVGWRIADAARFGMPGLRTVVVQQWTPELVEEIADAKLAIFVDASVRDEAGAIRVGVLRSPKAAQGDHTRGIQAETHQLDPLALLALAEEVCGHAPARSFLVTVGADSFHYGEDISARVRQAVPRAARLVGNLIATFAPGM